MLTLLPSILCDSLFSLTCITTISPLGSALYLVFNLHSVLQCPTDQLPSIKFTGTKRILMALTLTALQDNKQEILVLKKPWTSSP